MSFWSFIRDMIVLDWLFGVRHHNDCGHHDSSSYYDDYDDFDSDFDDF